MDFTLVERTEVDGICYKLLKANFYRNHYVIIVQNKSDFCCGSIQAAKCEVHKLFREIAVSKTEPHTLSDILNDLQKQLI